MTGEGYVIRRGVNGSGGLWQKGRPLLESLEIELTERCNNRCIHCYINQDAGDREQRVREMNTETVLRVIGEAAELGCLRVTLSGGEPLLRQDFREIYLYARRAGIAVTLCTNGCLIEEELADLFSRYPPGQPIVVTLYGMNEQSYAAVSGVAGGYDLAMQGVQRLVERQVPVLIKGVYTVYTADEVDEIEAFAARYSVGGRCGALTMNFNLRARRDSAEKNKVIRELRATPETTLAMLTRDGGRRYRGAMKAFVGKFMRPPGEALFSCGCGCGGSVDAYGMLQPCLLLRHPEVVYDLGSGTLREALTGFFPEVRRMVATNPSYLERCARCMLFGLCEQCPAQSWMEHGTLDTPVDYLCEIAHAQARYLGLLGEDEYGWQVDDWRARIERFVTGD